MAKNKQTAERRRRKALKRARRKSRGTDVRRPASGGDGFEPIEPWLHEVEDTPLCSSVAAEYFASASAELAAMLAMCAEEAREALAAWPDEERTRSLRGLLLELAREAEQDAAKLGARGERLTALFEQAGHHVHLEDGKVVAGDEHDDSSKLDEMLD